MNALHAVVRIILMFLDKEASPCGEASLFVYRGHPFIH